MFPLSPLRFRFRVALAVTGLVVASAACSPTEPGGSGAELRELPRALTAAEVSVRDASNRFAFDLFGKASAAAPGENVFVSPLSVSMSLGMVLNGAQGETRDQMRRTLGFDDAELATIQAGYRDLAGLLRGLDRATSFQVANSIWYDRIYNVEPAFLEAGRTWFDAEIQGVSFDDTEGVKRAVNSWVSAKTARRIPTILEEVHPDDVMYLINAIWFKGSWRSRFDVARTRDAEFTAADGRRQVARLMSQETDSAAGFRFYQDATVQAGELPYGNGAFAMTIVLPRPGTDIDAFAVSLSRDRWDAIVNGLRPTSGWTVEIPKFTLTYERELAEDLQALGMTDAFSPGRADLRGISPDLGLYVGFVKHKTFVTVDEAGTEAAAVTNTGIRVVSMPPSFRVDRPFVYAIRERLSGTVLFIGKMTELP